MGYFYVFDLYIFAHDFLNPKGKRLLYAFGLLFNESFFFSVAVVVGKTILADGDDSWWSAILLGPKVKWTFFFFFVIVNRKRCKFVYLPPRI